MKSVSYAKKVVKTNVTIVITDDFRSYKAFNDEVEHITIKDSGGYGIGMRTKNTIEEFWSIVKNGIKGSFMSVSKKYLLFLSCLALI